MIDVINKIIALQASLVAQGLHPNFTLHLESKDFLAIVAQLISGAKYINITNFNQVTTFDFNAPLGVIELQRNP